jgi:hypothetical protein
MLAEHHLTAALFEIFNEVPYREAVAAEERTIVDATIMADRARGRTRLTRAIPK